MSSKKPTLKQLDDSIKEYIDTKETSESVEDKVAQGLLEATAYTDEEIVLLAGETDSKIGILTDSVDGHNARIASVDELGHIKVGANLSIDIDGKLNASTGEAYALTDGARAKVFTGDLNNLVETGYYSVPKDTLNGVTNNNGSLVEVVISSNGLFITQRLRTELNHLVEGYFFRVGSRDSVADSFVWGPANPQQGAIVSGWRKDTMELSDSITNNHTGVAATANAVKQLNDKIEPIPLGLYPLAPFVSGSSGDFGVGKSGNIAVFNFKITNTQQLTTSENYQLCEILPVGYRNVRSGVVGYGQCFVSGVSRYLPITIYGGTVIMQNSPVTIPAGTTINGMIAFYVN